MRTAHPGITRPFLLIGGILLVAANLRAPVTGVAPLLGMIRDSTGISAAQAGALTTLPLVAFAAISPFAGLLARAWGIERSLFAALFLIGFGSTVRSLDPVWCLFLGTGLIGAGIAIANVLLPSLLKRDFPHRVGELTGAYALTAGLVAALVSALAAPLATLPGWGWREALAAFLVFPVVAAIVWAPQLASHTAPARTTEPTRLGEPIWRTALAWQVTFFMGFTSLVYYVVVGWLPTILVATGYSADAAGAIHGVSQLATAVPGLLVAPLIGRLKDQRGLAVSASLLTCLSLLGLWFMPAWAMVWAGLFGFGTGAAFILALSFISLRANNAQRATALSGMAQCVGYSLAAAGPPLAGYLHDHSGGWSLPLACCVAGTLIMAVLGSFAGRSRTI